VNAQAHRERPRRVVTRRTVSWTTVAGAVMLGVLVGIAWRATNAVWFLLFPLLVVGALSGAAMAVLWALRHF
jgi:hypothetical protein